MKELLDSGVISKEESEEKKKLLKVTKESLYLGIKAAQIGNNIGYIGSVIQNYAEQSGYGVVKDLVDATPISGPACV